VFWGEISIYIYNNVFLKNILSSLKSKGSFFEFLTYWISKFLHLPLTFRILYHSNSFRDTQTSQLFVIRSFECCLPSFSSLFF
jgi:hypothetical protein